MLCAQSTTASEAWADSWLFENNRNVTMASETGSDSSSGMRHGRVLVVDDEAAVANQLADGLTLLGRSVRQARSGREAIDLLEADPEISVVLTDVRMAEIDGLWLARHIRSVRTDDTAVEVVIITGHATIDDAAAAVRACVVDFLRKPFRLREASEAVARADARAMMRRRRAAIGRDVEQKLREIREVPPELAASDLPRNRHPGLAPDETVIPSDEDNLQRRELRAISHGLRTPLVAASFGAHLLGLDEGTLTGDGRKNLDLLQHSVQDAIDAVSLLEELQQLEFLQVSASPETVAASVALRRAAMLVQERALHRRVSVDISVPDAISLRFSRHEFIRLGYNCLMAAIEWAEPGEAITVQWRSIAEHTGELWFVVLPFGEAASMPGIAESSRWNSGTALSRTQEGLHFAIAGRLASRSAATLRSIGGSDRRMALVLHAALPGVPA